MRRLLQNKSVVAGLVTVAVFCIAANFMRGTKANVTTVAARTVAAAEIAPAVDSYPIRPHARFILELSDWPELLALDELPTRDPFRRTLRKTAGATRVIPSLPAPVFVVQAISIEGERAFAVINRRILTQGESIDGYVIDRIQPTEVRLNGPAGPILVGIRPSAPRRENVPIGK